MRTETVTKTIFTFDELSDRAKEKARDWYIEGIESQDVAEYVLEDAATICDLLGIDLSTRTVTLMDKSTRQEPQIYWSGFSSQGDGACFAGRYSYTKGSVKAIKDHAPKDNELHRIATELQSVQRQHFYKLSASLRHTGHYSHSHSVSIDVDTDGTRPVTSDDEDTVKEALRDLMDWIYRQLQTEYEYQTSDAQVTEAIIGNEYEFDEDGTRA